MNAKPPTSAAPSEQPKRRSLFGRAKRVSQLLGGTPLPSIGTSEISEGARLIGGLVNLLRRGPGRDPRLRATAAGQLDLDQTAYLHGLSVDQLLERIRDRRGATARAAYTFFALGTLLFLLWVRDALSLRLDGARIVSALEYLPFWLLFYLLSFKAAWTNWQLRTRRLGSPVEYLKTTELFLPR